MFGGRGITWIKVRLQIREAVGKVTEGVQFFTRGIRLLGSDCNNCGKLFYRAALGGLSPEPAGAGRLVTAMHLSLSTVQQSCLQERSKVLLCQLVFHLLTAGWRAFLGNSLEHVQ